MPSASVKTPTETSDLAHSFPRAMKKTPSRLRRIHTAQTRARQYSVGSTKSHTPHRQDLRTGFFARGKAGAKKHPIPQMHIQPKKSHSRENCAWRQWYCHPPSCTLSQAQSAPTRRTVFAFCQFASRAAVRTSIMFHLPLSRYLPALYPAPTSKLLF